MNDLLESLRIFSGYLKKDNLRNVFHCGHDIIYMCHIEPEDVSDTDIKRLEELGWFIENETEGFASFRYGGC